MFCPDGSFEVYAPPDAQYNKAAQILKDKRAPFFAKGVSLFDYY